MNPKYNCSCIFVCLLAVACTRAAVYSRCELVKELRINGLPDDQFPDWICLIESESSRNSSAVGGPNSNGSYDWGLFQINDRYWCKPGGIGGDCHMDCHDLVDDDITDDLKCTKKIYKRHGFSAWHGWTKRCENKTLPDLSPCNAKRPTKPALIAVNVKN